jgi:hypothetical protein
VLPPNSNSLLLLHCERTRCKDTFAQSFSHDEQCFASLSIALDATICGLGSSANADANRLDWLGRFGGFTYCSNVVTTTTAVFLFEPNYYGISIDCNGGLLAFAKYFE